MDDISLNDLLSYLFSRNSLRVETLYSNDIFFIRQPKIAQTSKTPKIALKKAIHSPEYPNPHPILPANPINKTAEKYAVPYENADIHGPTLPPPRKKSEKDFVFRKPIIPIIIIIKAYAANTIILTAIGVFFKNNVILKIKFVYYLLHACF